MAVPTATRVKHSPYSRSRSRIKSAGLADRRCFAQLLHDPFVGRRPRHPEVSNPPRSQFDDEKEEGMAELERCRTDLLSHLRSVEFSDEQIAEIEAFCADVREGLDNATFEDKRRYLDLLDVRGILALENDQKVVYITCKLGKQRVLQMQTLPLSNSQYGNSLPVTLTVRLVIEALKRRIPA